MTIVPISTFRFEIVLALDTPTPGFDSPLCDAAFAECDGLEMTMEPKVVESAGVTNRQQRLVGPIKYGQITLKRGMTDNLQLWQWFSQGVRPGSVLTAHGQITMWGSDGTPVVQFTLEGCLPVKMRAPGLNAKEGLIAIEELALVCSKLTIGAPGSDGFGLSAGIGVSAGVGFSASADVGFSAGGGF